MAGASKRRSEAELDQARKENAKLREAIEKLSENTKTLQETLKKANTKLLAADKIFADLKPDIREAVISIENNKDAELSAKRAAKRPRSAMSSISRKE